MKKIKLLAAATLLATSAGAAQAADYITSWDYFNEAGWTNYEPASAIDASGDSAGGATSILSTGSLPTDMCWGTPAAGGTGNQSCLRINSPMSNEGVEADRAMTAMMGENYEDFFVQGTSITHENFKLVAGDNNSLETVMLVDGLDLLGYSDGGNTPFLAPELQFNIAFNETFNQGGCDLSLPRNANGCADIFTFTDDFGGNVLDVNLEEGYIDFSVKFSIDQPGVWSNYELITRLSGLELLDNGQLGFYTMEEAENVLNAQFAIRAAVPEPSTLGIFALSLVGLGFVARRKA